LRALMTISRSAVGVGGGELACPVGFGVEEGFSAGGEGVAELGEGESELFNTFNRGFRGTGGFASIAGGELLGGREVAEAANVRELCCCCLGVLELPKHHLADADNLIDDVWFEPGEIPHRRPFE